MLHVATRRHNGLMERFIATHPLINEAPAAVVGRVAEAASPGHCIAVDIFGGMPTDASWREVKAALGPDSVPVTWVVEAGAENGEIRAVQAWAIEGADVHRLMHRGECVGTIFENAHARYVRLAGLLPDTADDPAAQTREVLDLMTALLSEANLAFCNVARTWFYLADILDWYDAFNAARTQFFQEYDVFGGLVPASTGMAGGNRKRCALTAGLLAVESKTPATKVLRVDSPLQCSARDYGSSFSRAVEITTPSGRRLLVSGTASIDPAGRTQFEGDLVAQVKRTFEVIEAILHARGMSWSEVTRAIGYFKPGQQADAQRLLQQLAPAIPIVPVINDVCRDDLLFEAELDAMFVQQEENA